MEKALYVFLRGIEAERENVRKTNHSSLTTHGIVCAAGNMEILPWRDTDFLDMPHFQYVQRILQNKLNTFVRKVLYDKLDEQVHPQDLYECTVARIILKKIGKIIPYLIRKNKIKIK